MDKKEIEQHFDDVAEKYDYWKRKNKYYYDVIKVHIKRIVPKGARVLEIGCGTGSILDSVKPSYGVGVDISQQMVDRAQKKYPNYTFIHSPIEELELNETFDYIIMIDVVDHVVDVMDVFQNVYKFCNLNTRIVLTTINPWWDPILSLAEKYELKMPEGPHNFIEKGHIRSIIELCNFTINQSGYLLLFPKYIPVLSYIANSIGVRIWGINKFSAVQHMLIQPVAKPTEELGYGCSVIIPCYNEEGNVEEAVRGIPNMGKGTEIIVVNDGSTDKTAEKVRSLQDEFPNLKLVDYSPNRGKGQAVKAGFDAATQEVIMIMDADMTVAPHELPRFFEPLNLGMCQFVNGTRMVYPMEDQSMRFLNLIGNKLFGLMMSFLIGQTLSDTLCGTKALYKSDYQRMKWGLDKWGDFDLLFGAAQMSLKIKEVPVHYMSRKSGVSKMKTFRHAIHLFWACFIGFSKLIFISPKRYYKDLNS